MSHRHDTSQHVSCDMRTRPSKRVPKLSFRETATSLTAGLRQGWTAVKGSRRTTPGRQAPLDRAAGPCPCIIVSEIVVLICLARRPTANLANVFSTHRMTRRLSRRLYPLSLLFFPSPHLPPLPPFHARWIHVPKYLRQLPARLGRPGHHQVRRQVDLHPCAEAIERAPRCGTASNCRAHLRVLAFSSGEKETGVVLQEQNVIWGREIQNADLQKAETRVRRE